MKTKTVVFLLFISFSGFAQKYGNIWQFGDHAGIDFNSCTPIYSTKGNNSGFEGCSSISDSAGQLLFYTNSDTVWNKLGVAMPNGHLLSTSGTLSQVIIIPKPLSISLYYVLTTMIQGQGPLRLEYHIVDMTLNGGLGDVISKNNILSDDTITEQVAATFHADGYDIWLMAHQYGTNNFLCYLVTSSGINMTPLISSVGPSLIPCSSNTNARGEMKFSPDGTKMAINNNGSGNDLNSDYLAIFDFDNYTGIVSNPINLPPERGGFGLSFSPDNSKLYGATWKALNFQTGDTNKVFQFDLSGNDSLTIVNSKKIIYSVLLTQESFGAMKLAPNGKIYVAYYGASYLAAINSPNQTGDLCNYVNQDLYLGGKTCEFGLNNYIEYKNYCDSTTSSSGALIADNSAEIKVNNLLAVNEALEISGLHSRFQIEIYNFFGQPVFTSFDYQNNFRVRVAGCYLYELVYPNGLRIEGKFVVIQ